MDKALSFIQKVQADRNKAEGRVPTNLMEMKCLELKNNLLFFSIDELVDEAEREDERCQRRVFKIMEDHMGLDNASMNIRINKASRLGRFDATKT